MANTFKNKLAASAGTTPVTLYTCPSGARAVMIGLVIANVSASNIAVDVKVTDSSPSTTCYLIKGATIAPGGSLVVVGAAQKLVLEENDSLIFLSDTASSADAVASYMEIT